MKLFENGVGRPSNEIKRKRKIFVISMAVLVLSFFMVGYFVLTNLSTNKLGGAAAKTTTIKVGEICNSEVSTKDNKIIITSNCSSNDSMYKVNIKDNKGNFIAKTYYKIEYGKGKNKTINLSKGTYKLDIYSKTKDANEKVKVKVEKNVSVTVEGKKYNNTFNLENKDMCVVPSTLNSLTDAARISCGTNTKISEVSIIGKDKNGKSITLSYSNLSDLTQLVQKFGEINNKINTNSQYKLRLYYKLINNKKNKTGVSTFVGTTNINNSSSNTTVTKKTTTAKKTTAAKTTTIKVGEICNSKVSTKDNKIIITSNCSSNDSMYKVNIKDNNGNFIAKTYYKIEYGKDKKKTINLSKGTYKLDIYSKTKDGNKKVKVEKNVSVTVKGKKYNNTFNLAEDQTCSLIDVKLSNGTIDSSIKCGKNAKPYEVHIINLTKKSDKYLDKDKFKESKYGYNSKITASNLDKGSKYKLRLYYKVKDNNTGISRFVTTSETITVK